jgi:hypothetical protein
MCTLSLDSLQNLATQFFLLASFFSFCQFATKGCGGGSSSGSALGGLLLEPLALQEPDLQRQDLSLRNEGLVEEAQNLRQTLAAHQPWGQEKRHTCLDISLPVVCGWWC